MDENMCVRKGKNGVLLHLCLMPPSVFLPVIDTGTLSVSVPLLTHTFSYTLQVSWELRDDPVPL